MEPGDWKLLWLAVAILAVDVVLLFIAAGLYASFVVKKSPAPPKPESAPELAAWRALPRQQALSTHAVDEVQYRYCYVNRVGMKRGPWSEPSATCFVQTGSSPVLQAHATSTALIFWQRRENGQPWHQALLAPLMADTTTAALNVKPLQIASSVDATMRSSLYMDSL